MISLIKGGAFDKMMERKMCMGWYLWEVCDKKKRLTLQNLPSLIKYNLLPTDTEEQVMARRVYEFNRYLKAVCLNKAKTVFVLDTRALDFLCEIGKDDLITSSGSSTYLDPKVWDKVYQKWMDVFRNWITEDKDKILYELNAIIFKEEWDKYAKGTISAWEMEALCFYYHEHELEDVNAYRYGLVDFFNLPEEPVVEKSFERGGKTINMFKLSKICGTCIAKNKTKSTVTLLTTSGVVNVKFRKEYFALFDKQISAMGADGARHVVEKSWFNRGSMIVVQGMRSGDDFVSKKYASTGGHQLYKIDAILNNGELMLKDSRYQGGIEEDA
jgi:DNA polymerase-3 subunit alpha